MSLARHVQKHRNLPCTNLRVPDTVPEGQWELIGQELWGEKTDRLRLVFC